jgi:small nuclear ribonucleoprotein (snRNP)-like protein
VSRLLRQRLLRRVLVTLKSGASFAGVLYAADRETLILRNAQQLDVPDQGAVPADGEMLLFRADVDFMQLP